MKNLTKINYRSFCMIISLAGFEHGIGEILQGNNKPESIFIESWPKSDLYQVLAGEPAMTIIPNLLVSGILTVFISLLLLLWSIRDKSRSHQGLTIFIFSVILLLVGGGFGPPLMGIIISIITGIYYIMMKSPKTIESTNLKRKYEIFWKICYFICLISYLSLWPGVIIWGKLIGAVHPNFVSAFSAIAFISLLSTMITGVLHDK